MNILKGMSEVCAYRKCLEATDTLGFVPTMGALHEGHFEIVKKSQKENSKTVVSIFVNPLQFNNSEDFEKYPRDYEKDCHHLKRLGVNAVFFPDTQEFYPSGNSIRVSEYEESKILEGEFRPGHFEGVLTVVMKLFSCVQPHRAYFGEKDYQQLRLIQKMVRELFLPLHIVSCTTIRDSRGLALSSRNMRLSEDERKFLSEFFKTLRGHSDLNECRQRLESLGLKVEYVVDKWGRRLSAVEYQGVRFIDNVSCDEISQEKSLGVEKYDTHA